MHLCIFDHRSTRLSNGLHYLVLHLPARTLLGLSERRILLTYSLYPPSRLDGICPLVFFKWGVFQTPWPFNEKIEESFLFLRVVCIVLAVQRFPNKCSEVVRNISDPASNVFQKWSPEMLENLLVLSMRDVFICPFLSLWGFSALVSGFSDRHTFVWRRFLWSLCPLFSWLSRGFSEVLGRNALLLQAIYR